MKNSLWVRVVLLTALASTTCLVQAVAQSNRTESLGEVARRFREEKAKSPTKAAKVYTNDNIPKNVVIGVAPAPTVEMTTPPSLPAGGELHDEKYYRKAKDEIMDRKQLHERELNVLQEKLGQNNMQYYPDPNKTLQQEYSRSDIKKLQDDIEKKKAEIADDDKALSDLEDQLRRDGGDPGWIR